ncbi:MAG TPA: hypoxanthine phosphoribosyltransferase [Candidatus Dormibacteraeota bacterium]|nr:hypoxanthine phosphoribosyltransferase [Candidatus Dormibacteraeota bacterium]
MASELAPLPEGVAEVIFSSAELAAAVGRLAERIAADYRDREVLLVGVLKGALFFAADLARALHRAGLAPDRMTLDFIAVSSYGNSRRSSGEVRLLKDTSESAEGRHVLIVEDIVDNGHTLHYLRSMFGGRAPASLAACALLDKPFHRGVDVPVEYVGLEAPDEFVVGYGLDYQESYRHLPYVARLHPWVYRD